MSNSTGQNHFSILGNDGLSYLTVYKVPASSFEGEGDFIISVSSGGPANTITISDTYATELVRLFAGLICSSEIERLKTINDGQELKPLSPPLQNLLKHIQNAAAGDSNETQ